MATRISPGARVAAVSIAKRFMGMRDTRTVSIEIYNTHQSESDRVVDIQVHRKEYIISAEDIGVDELNIEAAVDAALAISCAGAMRIMASRCSGALPYATAWLEFWRFASQSDEDSAGSAAAASSWSASKQEEETVEHSDAARKRRFQDAAPPPPPDR